MDDSPPLLDTRGLRCPLPVLKARRRLRTMPRGARLVVLSDDPASQIDFPHFCTEQAHGLEQFAEERSGVFRFLIRKGAPD